MKFFVPLDEAPLGTHPELIGALVPFILDYPCYRRLKEGSPEIGMAVKAVFNTEKPTNTVLDLAWVPA